MTKSRYAVIHPHARLSHQTICLHCSFATDDIGLSRLGSRVSADCMHEMQNDRSIAHPSAPSLFKAAAPIRTVTQIAYKHAYYVLLKGNRVYVASLSSSKSNQFRAHIRRLTLSFAGHRTEPDLACPGNQSCAYPRFMILIT